VLLSSCSQNSRKFTIQATIDGMPEQTVILQQLSSDVMIKLVDSTHSDANGKFEISGVSPEPGLYRLTFGSGRYIMLSIDKGLIKINSNWSKIQDYHLEGSDASLQLQQFLGSIRQFVYDLNAYSRVIDTQIAHGNDSLRNDAEKAQQDVALKFTSFIEKYADTTAYLPNAVFAATMLNPATEMTFLDELSQSLLHRFPNAHMSKDFSVYCINTSRKVNKQAPKSINVQVGMPAPDLNLPDRDGQPQSLAQCRGKYTLVNFWASWDRPSYEDITLVDKTNAKFAKNGFTVYNVSLDNQKAVWEKAIKDKGTHLMDVCDFKGMHSDAAIIYSVKRLPANFLLDTSGKVVAKNMSGPALDDFLNRVLIRK
jgi:peroxiredoxin